MNKVGNQTPRIDIYTPGDTERAELLFELLDEYGMTLLEWQRHVLRRWLAEDEKGNFVNVSCGLCVARQNGKTEILVARIIYGIIFRHATGLFTAQQQDTADVVKKRVQDFFYDNEHEEIFNLLTDQFRARPKNYDFIDFQFNNGDKAQYKFKTRTRLGGLGTGNDDLICDEAADMMDSHQATLQPTISAAKSGNPQIIYCGTPPMAESVGAVFARRRKKVMSGGRGCWTEWGVENFTSKEDKKAWYEANPSLGRFLLLPAVQEESESLTDDDFNRMRLGWWSGAEDKRAISQRTWDSLINTKPEFDDTLMPVYAVKFPPDRSNHSLAVAQPLIDGKIHVEVVLNRPMSDGFQRLSEWIIKRWKDAAVIIIDGDAGKPILLEDLISGGVPDNRIIQPTVKEVVAAHQFTLDAITQGELSHNDQPLLNHTVKVTTQRSIGKYGGFGWDSMSEHLSTSALDAVTFALWGQKVFPKKKLTDEDKAANKAKLQKILSSL